MDALDSFFYPHKLQLKIGGIWVDQFNCGEQPNAGGSKTNTASRVDYIYKSTIFYPKTASNYKFIDGEEIRVIDEDGKIRISGTVARFSEGRLEDNRIWI